MWDFLFGQVVTTTRTVTVREREISIIRTYTKDVEPNKANLND